MKSKSNQKRIKRSIRKLNGGKPVPKSQVQMALFSAQDLARELTSMLSLIEQQSPLPRLSIVNNLKSAESLVGILRHMLVTVNKEALPPPTLPNPEEKKKLQDELRERKVLEWMDRIKIVRKEHFKGENRFNPSAEYVELSNEELRAEALDHIKKEQQEADEVEEIERRMWGLKGEFKDAADKAR